MSKQGLTADQIRMTDYLEREFTRVCRGRRACPNYHPLDEACGVCWKRSERFIHELPENLKP